MSLKDYPHDHPGVEDRLQRLEQLALYQAHQIAELRAEVEELHDLNDIALQVACPR